MKNTATALAIMFMFSATTAYGENFEGPLVIKNGHPLYAALGSPSLVSAQPENSIDIGFSYSSTYLVEGQKDWHFGIDVETALLDIQLKHVVGGGTEVGLDLPLIRYGAGFMDDFIETYHRVLGMPGAYGRDNRPRNAYLLDVTRNGKDVIVGKPGKTLLGDVMIEIKKTLSQRAGSVVSVQGFMNLPTGDPDSGYGSGKPNGGIALLMNEQLRGDSMLYVNAGIGFIHQLRALQQVELNNYYYGGAGLEWLFVEKISLHAQLFVQSSPFPKTGVRSIDDPSMLASIGGRYKITDKSALGVAVTEDPDTSGAPDLMVGVDYRYRY